MTISPKHVALGFGSAAMISLTACATGYTAPTDPALSASIDVYKGYKTGVGFGTGTQQEYSVYSNDQCDAPARLASFTWTNGEKKNKRIAANTPLRIGAFTNYFSPSGNGYWNGTAYVSGTDVNTCRTFARFTPKAGANYKLIQTEEPNRTCTIEIIDLSTSKAPEDLMIGEHETCPNLAANAQKANKEEAKE